MDTIVDNTQNDDNDDKVFVFFQMSLLVEFRCF